MRIRDLVVAIAIAAPGVAGASQCAPDMEKVDLALAAPPTVSLDAFNAAKMLRAEAGEHMSAGRDVECVVAIGEAMQFLDIAEGD